MKAKEKRENSTSVTSVGDRFAKGSFTGLGLLYVAILVLRNRVTSTNKNSAAEQGDKS